MSDTAKPSGPIFHRIFNAAIEGQSNVVKSLLENDPDKHVSVLYPMAFKEAAEAGHLDTVNVFLAHNIEYAQNHLALSFALMRGHIHVFDRLVGISNVQARNNALSAAASGGFVPAVKELLKHISDCDILADGLEKAALVGNLEIVELLTPLVPEDKRPAALVLSIAHQNYPVIRHLLPLCDPKHNNSEALQTAVEEQLWDVADLLYPISDPYAAFENLMEYVDEECKNHAIEYFNKYFSVEQKEVITNALKSESFAISPKTHKKM